MSKRVLIGFEIALICLIITGVKCERTKDKMYESINGASCFRRLNGTHQTGCTSPSSGSVGALHVIRSSKDIDFLLNSPPSPPYAAVIPTALFNRENVLRLRDEASDFISAIIVTNQLQNQSFSNELNCPNQFSGLNTGQSCDRNAETTWNPYGSGLLHENFNFPIFYVADYEEIKKIEDCFEKFNNFDIENQASRSLCTIQVNSFMSAAVNSEVCIRRTNFVNNLSPTRYCDPLQGKNIYSTLFPREVVQNEKRFVDRDEKIILISARIDTTSMFDGVGLGAMDSLQSFATLISTAHFLSKLIPEQGEIEENVLFMIFNGESYDYIGSQRLVYDLQNAGFPHKNTHSNLLTLDNIAFMIDLGALDDTQNLRFYSAKSFNNSNDFFNLFSSYNQRFDFGLKVTQIESEILPPTSAQSFLRENLTFPAVILNTKPTNQFYHSIYDDAVNIGFVYGNTSKDFTALESYLDFDNFAPDSVQIKIRNISSAIALSVYEMIKRRNYDGTKIASAALTDEFLYCFLQSANCTLFKAASHPASLPGLPSPPYRYISVQGSLSHEAFGWTYRILGFLTGQKIETIKEENCNPLPLYWFRGVNGQGECRYTTQNYSQAYSPAFLLDDYDWKSGKYSTWTESTWRELNARIFLKPSRTHEAVTLALGIIVMLISFVIVFLINTRSEVLFENALSSRETTIPTSNIPAAC